jgi:4-hydroxy-3-methylbut-2-enyl diphosphate reductase
MEGIEEHAEFRLPAELEDARPAVAATRQTEPQPEPQTAAG